MAIWQSFWPQFWYQTMISQTQPQDKVPMMSEMYPWFEEKDILKLQNLTASITDPVEKTKVQNELYRKVLPQVINEQNMAKRDAMKNNQTFEAVNEKDPAIQKQKQWSLKLADLSDQIKTKFNLPATAQDSDILGQFVKQTPNGQQMMIDYLNGTNEDILTKTGLKVAPVVEEKGWFMQTVKNIIWWVWDSATWIAQFIGNLWAEKAYKDMIKSWVPEAKARELVDGFKNYLEESKISKTSGSDTESIWYKVSKTVTDIAQIANPAWLGKAWLKAGQIASNVWKVGWLVGKVAKWVTEAVVDTAIFMPQSEQRMATKWELATSAIIWGVLPVAWTLVKKAKEKIWKFGAKLYASTIKLNPSQIKKIAKTNVAGVEPERRLMDKNIKWNLSQIQTQLDDIAESSYKELNTKAWLIKWEYSSTSWKTILSALKKKVSWVEWLEEINTKLDTLISKDKFSLTEMFDIKRTLDKRIWMYSKSGDPIAQEVAEWLRNLRDRLWKDIDWIAWSQWLTDLRLLSKDIQVSTEISNALENTIARESKNRIMSLTDIIVWWGVAWWVYASTDDPLKTLQVVAWLLVTKKIFENPAIRTKLAIQLDKLAPKVQTTIKNAIQTGTPLNITMKDILKKAFTQAWVKLLPNKQQ